MKRSFRKSIKPLIGSIFISIILWFMVTTSKEYTTHIQVPLEITRLARGKTLLEPIPFKANIEVQGSGQSIIGLYFYNARFRLELPNITKSQKIQLSDYLNYLDIPSKLGLKVIKILEPAVLNLKVDDFSVSSRPIKFTGQLLTEPGYVVLDTAFSQDSIQISGPKTLVNNIKYVETQPVTYKMKKYSFNDRISLQSPHPALINIYPAEIDVAFEIQRIIERVVYDVPIEIKNTPKNLIVEAIPPSLSLRVKGGEKLVEKLAAEEIIAEIDFSIQYDPEKNEYAVRLKTPAKISWLESSPKTVNLKVRRK